MKMKALFIGVGLVAMSMTPQAQAIQLTAAHINPPGEPTNIAFSALAGMINASGLDMTMKVYPQGQVGNAPDAVEQVIEGSLTMTSEANAQLEPFAPAVGVFDIPFLFRDADKQPWAVADGPIGKEIDQQVKKKIGVDVVAWWSAGMRHMFTKNKPIREPSDLKGLKVRVMQDKLYIDLFNTLGAKPTPLPYGELYQSLATHVVDAAENDTSGYRNMKFYEVAPTLSLTGHTFLYKPVIANAAQMAKLNPAQRKYFDTALRWATCYQRYLFAHNFETNIAWLKKHGVKVYSADRPAFQKALQPMIEKYAKKYGESLVKRIMDTPSNAPNICTNLME